MQIEKIIETAEDLKLATYRAEHAGICGFTHITNKEHFLIHDEDIFKKLMEDNSYKIEDFNVKGSDYIYEYIVNVGGLNFVYLARELFDRDIPMQEGERNV